MHLLRKQDKSIYYFLSDLFNAYPFITVVDGFPKENLSLPTVSVEALDLRIKEFELGNRVGLRIRPWSIDVFASNKEQRDELSYLVVDALENGIPVYNYDEGFPPDISPTQIGTLEVLPNSIQAAVVRIFPDFTEKLYWRMSITFSTVYHPK